MTTTKPQEIAVIGPDGKHGNYTHMRFLDDEAPTAGGRDIWGVGGESITVRRAKNL